MTVAILQDLVGSPIPSSASPVLTLTRVAYIQGSVGTLTTTTTSVQAGDILVAFAHGHQVPTMTVSDSSSTGSWTWLTSASQSDAMIWYKQFLTPAGSFTVSLAQGGGWTTQMQLCVIRVRGYKNSSPFGTNFTQVAAAVSTYTGSLTSTVDNSTLLTTISGDSQSTAPASNDQTVGSTIVGAPWCVGYGTKVLDVAGTNLYNWKFANGTATNFRIAGAEVIPRKFNIDFYGGVWGDNTATNPQVSSAIAFTPGLWIVAAQSARGCGANAITDSSGTGAWTRAGVAGTGSETAIYYKQFTTSGNYTVSFTTTLGSSGSRCFQVMSATGAPTGTVVGAVAGTDVGSTASVDTSITTTGTDSIIVVSGYNSVASTVMSSTLWSTPQNYSVGSESGVFGYQGAANPGTRNVNVNSVAGTNSWKVVAVEFLATSPLTTQTDSETGSAVDDAGTLTRTPDGETFAAADDATLTATTIQTATEVGSATEAATLFVTLTGTESFSATDAANAPDVALTDSEGLAAADAATLTKAFPDTETFSLVDAATALSVIDLTPYKFRPPSVEGERDNTHPLWRRLRHPVGLAVLKIGGLYKQVANPGSDDIAAATEVYLGGHVHTVDLATKNALTAAGYGAYVNIEE
jgi:hypothetical protein